MFRDEHVFLLMIDAEAKARAIATEAEAGAVEDPVDRVKAAGEAEEQAVDAVDRVGDSVLEADPLAAGREV